MVRYRVPSGVLRLNDFRGSSLALPFASAPAISAIRIRAATRPAIFQMMTTLDGRLDDPLAWMGSVGDDQCRAIDRLYATHVNGVVGLHHEPLNLQKAGRSGSVSALLV